MDSDGISSKRSFFYYRSLAFFSLLIFVGIIFLGIFLWTLVTGKLEKHIFGLMCASLVITPLSVYSIYTQLTKVHDFSVNKDAIVVKGKICLIADIVNISFNGKKNYAELDKIEGMKITFKGNRTLYIYDRYYRNIANIKNYLNNIWQQTEALAQQPGNNPLLNNLQPLKNHFHFHKGGIFTGRLLIVICFFALALLLFINTPFNYMAITLILPVWLIITLSTKFYYIGIGEHFITMKNFANPWLKQSYEITHIREIFLEKNGKGPNSITIITSDFKTKKYTTTTIYGKYWQILTKALIVKGIKVR